MNKLFYPAIFHKEGQGFWVSFPDIPECFTEGDNMEMAYEMAVDALGLAITSRKNEKQEIQTHQPDCSFHHRHSCGAGRHPSAQTRPAA